MKPKTNKPLRELILSAILISISVELHYYLRYIIGIWHFSFKYSFFVFSSLLVSPIYGAAIRQISDIISCLFFNIEGGFWPDLNLLYALQGAFPGIILIILKFIDKNKKLRFFIFILTMIFVNFFLCYLFSINIGDEIKKVSFFFIKIPINKKNITYIFTFFSSLFVFFTMIFSFIMKRKRKKNEIYNINVYEINTILILSIIIFDLALNSLVTSYHIEVPFQIYLIKRIIFLFKHSFIDSILVVTLLSFAKRNKKIMIN